MLFLQHDRRQMFAESFRRPRRIAELGLTTHGPKRASLEHVIRPYTPLEALTQRIIRCAIEVHSVLGAGLLESVYRDCLICELEANGLIVESGKHVPIIYKNRKVGDGLRPDLLIEDTVIVELKAVDALHPVHEAQLITYLKLTGRPAGLLMNFNSVLLKDGLRRLDHPDRYHRKTPRGI